MVFRIILIGIDIASGCSLGFSVTGPGVVMMHHCITGTLEVHKSTISVPMGYSIEGGRPLSFAFSGLCLFKIALLCWVSV